MNNPQTALNAANAEEPAHAPSIAHPFHSMLWKQGLFVALVVILTAASLGAVSFVFTRQTLERQIHDRLGAVAAARRLEVEMFASQQRERVKLVASRTRLRTLMGQQKDQPKIDPQLQAGMRRILLDALANTDGFLAIWVVDPSGRVMAATDDRYYEQRFDRHPDFLAGTRAASLGIPEEQAPDRALAAAPAKDDRGQLLGVVLVQLNMRQLTQILSITRGLGASGEVVVGSVENDQFRFLLPTRINGHAFQPPDAVPSMVRALEVEDNDGVTMNHGTFTESGRRVLAAYTTVDYQPGVRRWAMTARLDAAEAYEPIRQLWQLTMALLAVLLVVGVALAFLLARRFTAPLVDMAETAAAISAGNLEARVSETARADEIGVLARTLNDMARRLGDARANLEQRVEQRTEQLARANAALAKARDAAEAASRAKSTFLASMSHEIRTPMNAVIGMTELALHTEPGETQREYLETVRESGEVLLDIINAILDFSKIEAGKLELEDIPFDLHDCIDGTMKLMGVRAHHKGLELACRVEESTPQFVVGDPSRLRQVIINLIGNAIKFTEQGEVVLELSATQIAETDGAPKAPGTRDVGPSDEAVAAIYEITGCVRDTGIGIEPEKQRAIFSAFEQADSAMSRQFGGTGLGLAISKQLVELMGGSIQVQSTIGQGSEFSFSIRLRACDETQIEDSSEPRLLAPIDWRTKHVLIVDDNRTNRMILQEIIRVWGNDSTAVGDARAALLALQRDAADGRPFDLMICDVNMPEVTGLDLLAQVRNDPALQDLKVLMLSSGHDGSDIDPTSAAGFLMKPASRQELSRAVARLFGNLIPQPSSAQETADEQPLPSLRVLLAEDSPVNQRLACGLLERQGHEVAVATDGNRALEQLRDSEFDIILMDVQMPNLDGLEATRRIRSLSDPDKSGIPIVAMTAHAIKGDRELCLEAGMDDYVSKPIRPHRMFAAMRRAIQRRAANS